MNRDELVTLTGTIHSDNEARAQRLLNGVHPLGLMGFQLQILNERFMALVEETLDDEQVAKVEHAFELKMEKVLQQMEQAITRAKLLEGVTSVAPPIN